jgi:hypothetical protein
MLFLASFFLGLDKGGLKTLLVLCMYFLTMIVDSKDMLSILAPIMFIGDIIPIYIYKEKVNKRAVFGFLPYVIAGIFIAGVLSKNLDDKYFTLIIAIFILTMAVMMNINQFRKNNETTKKENKPLPTLVKIILGFITGVSSLSNSAAAITNTYFFRETKTKEEFIGSSSAFFFFVNGLKLIVIAFIWKTISIDTLLLSLAMIPGALFGIFVATKLVKKMHEKVFKIIIIISVYYVGIMLLINNIL